MESVKTLLITQARTGSTRLPGKVLLKVGGKELLNIHLERLSKCEKVDHIIVATTKEFEDNVIADLCADWGMEVFRGDVEDVLDRFYKAAKGLEPEWVVRVTSDCPLVDPYLIDALIALAQVNDVDYCSNGIIENFPDGQDIEVFKFSALTVAWREAKLKSDREHVTPFIRKNASCSGGELFTAVNFPCVYDYSAVRMTVDEPKDFELIERLISELGVNESWLDYTDHIIKNKLSDINSHILRNEGFLRSLKKDKNG